MRASFQICCTRIHVRQDDGCPTYQLPAQLFNRCLSVWRPRLRLTHSSNETFISRAKDERKAKRKVKRYGKAARMNVACGEYRDLQLEVGRPGETLYRVTPSCSPEISFIQNTTWDHGGTRGLLWNMYCSWVGCSLVWWWGILWCRMIWGWWEWLEWHLINWRRQDSQREISWWREGLA